MQVCLREERQRDDCIAAYNELQTVLDSEWRIDYACKCDSMANDMLTIIQQLRSTEEHLAKLQQDIIGLTHAPTRTCTCTYHCLTSHNHHTHASTH